MPFDVLAHTILLTRAGSRAYAINRPDSDVDVKGVCVPPARYILGQSVFEQYTLQPIDKEFAIMLSDEERAIVDRDGIDGTVFDLRKFIRLAADCNPNILDVLFADNHDQLLGTSSGEKLLESRGLFLSARAKFTFSGYAIQQLKRLQTHRRYLLNPPTHKPTRAEFGLPEHTLIPRDQLAAAQALIQKQIDSWEMDLSKVPDDADRQQIIQQLRESMSTVIAAALPDMTEEGAKHRAAARLVGVDDNLLLVLDRERAYAKAKGEWDSHEHWKTTRNISRASLEAQHGYDTKHGAHLVRLMRMCREILVDGKVNVSRQNIDADELRAIRNGAWDYDRLLAFAESEDAALTEIYRGGKFAIPKKPDHARIEDLCMMLLRRALK